MFQGLLFTKKLFLICKMTESVDKKSERKEWLDFSGCCFKFVSFKYFNSFGFIEKNLHGKSLRILKSICTTFFFNYLIV